MNESIEDILHMLESLMVKVVSLDPCSPLQDDISIIHSLVSKLKEE